MRFEKQDLDLILVPSGLILMFVYHVFLLYRYLHPPEKTVMGFENHDKKAWVHGILKEKKRDTGTFLSVVSTNVSAATFLSSVSLTLSSLIGAWISSSSDNFIQSELIYGDTRPTTISIKYICLLICFLLAFACFVQSTRNFVHANYLITTPSGVSEIPPKSVERAIVRGSDFWSVGLRALYFALDLLLWFFGPIPMFVGSVLMVALLYYLDYNSMPFHEHKFGGSEMVNTMEQGDAEAALKIQHQHQHQHQHHRE